MQKQFNRLFLGAFLLITSLSFSAFAGDSISNDVELVKDYILNSEYLELFDTTHYRIKCENIIVDDIDGDGITEAILHMFPHFRQSPTILIYKINKGKVNRVAEGLAPGEPVGLSDKYLDAHTLGLAVDMVAQDKRPIDPATLFAIGKKQNPGHYVFYRSFIHMDMRKGSPSFLDMRHIDKLPGKPQTCEGFEFPDVLEIHIANYLDKGKCLFALTESGLFIYKIKHIQENGLLDKELIVKKLKFNPKSMITAANGNILVIDDKGKSHNIN